MREEEGKPEGTMKKARQAWDKQHGVHKLQVACCIGA